MGLCFSLASALVVVVSHPFLESTTALRSLLSVGLLILLGGFCLVAALRTWPVTLKKLWSFIPWDKRPSRPLTPNDAIPLILTAAVVVGFGFLASLTTTKLAGLAAAVVMISAVFRHAFEAPTQTGRKVLAQLNDFREFLARTDADRLNRENQPERRRCRSENPALMPSLWGSNTPGVKNSPKTCWSFCRFTEPMDGGCLMRGAAMTGFSSCGRAPQSSRCIAMRHGLRAQGGCSQGLNTGSAAACNGAMQP